MGKRTAEQINLENEQFAKTNGKEITSKFTIASVIILLIKDILQIELSIKYILRTKVIPSVRHPALSEPIPIILL